MFSLIPPVIVKNKADRANGSSNAFWITMYGNTGSNAAVLAQEQGEFVIWKWLRLYGPGLAILSLLAWFIDPLFLALSPVVLVAQRFPPYRRAMELWGHEVEAQAVELLYGTSADVMRKWEVAALTNPTGYDGIFKGWTEQRVEAAMRSNSASAARYVRSIRETLEQFKGAYR